VGITFFSVYCITAARSGWDDGKFELIAGSMVVDPQGKIIAESKTNGDELVVADIDLDACRYVDTWAYFCGPCRFLRADPSVDRESPGHFASTSTAGRNIMVSLRSKSASWSPQMLSSFYTTSQGQLKATQGNLGMPKGSGRCRRWASPRRTLSTLRNRQPYKPHNLQRETIETALTRFGTFVHA
jgi:hypothetical protein